MPHFFIDENTITDRIITISDKDNYTHIAKALHAKIGESLLLIDNQQVQYETIIEQITSSKIITRLQKAYKSNRFLPINLYLAQAALKKEAQATVIQKACELGVKGIYPLVTDNCVIKKNYLNEKNEKYNKLCYEASKQCERPDIATVFEANDIESMLKDNSFDIKIACVEKHANSTLKACLKSLKLQKESKILVFIGPEGGFSEREFQLLKESKIPMVSLGNLILRADTAVISALSNIIYGLTNE